MTQWFQNDVYNIQDDPALFDVKAIHTLLVEYTYWAQNRTLAQVIHSIQHSYCLGAASPSGKQLGFARVVTDWTTFAWICDVVVLPEARGLGIGKQLVACIVNHPDLKKVRRLMLATRDAHGLYQQYGFLVEDDPQSLMKRINQQEGRPPVIE